MSIRGDPSATRRRGVLLHVGIRGPLGSGEPQRAVVYSTLIDVPGERPSGFKLVITLKTAKALGLTVPQSILVRVDQAIQ